MKKNKIVLAILAYGLILSGNAYAFTTTGNMGVSAQIIGDCDIAVNDLDFGVVSLRSGSLSTTTVEVTCPLGETAFLKFFGGQNQYGPTFGGGRQMSQSIAGVPHYVQYRLYKDSARTDYYDPFPSDTHSALLLSGTGVTETIPIYGEIPIQSSQPSGIYTDVVRVLLTY